MKYQAVLWDLDGTLLNTLSDLTAATNATLAHFHCPARSQEQVRQFVGNGAKKLLEQALPGLPTDPPVEEALCWFRAYYEKHNNRATQPYDGILEALATLQRLGCKQAILSNKPDGAVKLLWRDYFQNTVAYAQGESPDCPRKPSPVMLEKAMEKLGVSREETVYIGDSEVDIATAKAANVACISVLWGFREKEELENAGAARFCVRPAELVEMIGYGK